MKNARKYLKKYQNDKRVLKKLAEANALIDRIGVPNDLQEKQEGIYETNVG